MLDADKPQELSEEECATLIKILTLRNQQYELEVESIYLRGCYDSLRHLKKAGVLTE